jgi:molybdopterin converting factor small subunit
MPYSQETGGRGYPLPFVSNPLQNDVERIREALRRIDEDIHALMHGAVTLAELNAKISGTPKIAGDAVATSSTNGLMSAADKTKLDGLGAGISESDVIALIIALS